ncbi:MAG: hypothetical protein EBR82_18095 [Caulobacteraceae bacterium]|nr:hypothetical protein [Caulobacteraceae bacterium]
MTATALSSLRPNLPRLRRFLPGRDGMDFSREGLARRLRSRVIMIQARHTIVFGFNALQRRSLSVAGQETRVGGQVLPGAVRMKGA